MAKRVVRIKYSEDLREGQVIQKAYSIMRNNQFEPEIVESSYYPSIGIGFGRFYFKKKINSENEEKLEKILGKINLEEVEFL